MNDNGTSWRTGVYVIQESLTKGMQLIQDFLPTGIQKSLVKGLHVIQDSFTTSIPIWQESLPASVQAFFPTTSINIRYSQVATVKYPFFHLNIAEL
jgi:hypothetical protein